GKVAVAKVVIRTRQHLAALIVQGPLLVLNLLRFPEELRDPSALDLPAVGSKRGEFSPQEIKMAEQLVETMSDKWNPEAYHDEYREDLLKLIDKKVKAGQTREVEQAGPARRPERRDNVIDIMHLLKQSVNQAQKKEEPARRRRKAS